MNRCFSLFYCWVLCCLLHSGQILRLVSSFKRFKLIWGFFSLSAPSSSFWRRFRRTHVVSGCAPDLAHVTYRQLSGRFPKSRFLAAGHVLAAVARRHTLMWNLVGQMWCEHINDRHTDESNQATSSCFSSESVLIITT